MLTNARVREDGRVVGDVCLFEVKRPEDSRSEWDLYAVKAKLGPDQALASYGGGWVSDGADLGGVWV